MVVVSGSWVKNVATYPTPASDNDMVIPTTNNKMNAKAILTCRPNSHPFQERTLTLDQPVKVGRSVARARATPTNAIFDCKVLSRHHALLWYDTGKFYLQDTKSSNGTFVNNNRLSSSDSEPHEVCSGDIVQFGVDVVENNRKVTHCCIVATLKLYLADGKEAKASPSITESSRQGLVPLDELYKLNQLIQEACQREQCLESKLTTLQHIVEETRRSADESWQAYIGEERLLSRVATLENQLAQANKNITDERLREELAKLQEEKTSYQAVAKEALCKLHAERLEAVSAATEQERAKASAEQELNLIKEQLAQVQQELQEVAHKLMSEQKKSDEDKMQLEQKERELQARLDSQTHVVNELQGKLDHFKSLVNNSGKDLLPLQEIEKFIQSEIYTDSMKSKEELLSENENCEDLDNNEEDDLDEPQQNHINLRVGPVNDSDLDMCQDSFDNDVDGELAKALHISFGKEQADFEDDDAAEKQEYERETQDDSELTKNDLENLQSQNGQLEEDDYRKYKDRCDMEKIDSRTLKYQFQSVQNELKKQIEQLQQQSVINKSKITELESALMEEKQLSFRKSEECAVLRKELNVLQLKWQESCNEMELMHEKVLSLSGQLADSSMTFHSTVGSKATNHGDTVDFGVQAHRSNNIELNSTISPSLSPEQIEALEEELVLLKERYAAVNDEKLVLSKSLASIQEQYNAACNRTHNTMFFYIAPLVLAVLYLLISQHFS